MWKKFGEDCLKYLDGMYAFSIWDGNYLNLVTDRFSENHYLSMNKKIKLYFLQSQRFFMSFLRMIYW